MHTLMTTRHVRAFAFPRTQKIRWIIGVVVAAAMAMSPAANAPAGEVVISQVYGGGGNSGAALTNDFVEVHNNTSAPVSLDGWSIQYGSAAGTSQQITKLAGTIAAGGYYLVQEAVGAGGTTPLPRPDATGTIPMSATAGKVFLVSNTTAGTCAGTPIPAPRARERLWMPLDSVRRRTSLRRRRRRLCRTQRRPSEAAVAARTRMITVPILQSVRRTRATPLRRCLPAADR